MIPCQNCRNEMKADNEGNLTCKHCHTKVHGEFKKLWHRLSCKGCWNYWTWYDFKQWLQPFKSLDHVPPYTSGASNSRR